MKEYKVPLGVIVTPPIRHSPYLLELYRHLTKKVDVFQLTEFTLQFWRLIDLRKKARIIHIHWLEYLYRHRLHRILLINIIVPYLLMTCKCMHYVIVVTLHNIKPHESILIDKPMFKILLNLCDRIIVHNKFSAREALRMYGKDLEQKIDIIPHGNFISYFPNETTRHEARKMLQLENDKFFFLFFGHLRPYKGLEETVEAFKTASQRTKRIALMIVGRPISNEYESLIKSKVQKLDNCMVRCEYVPDSEVQLYLNAIDVGVSNYRETTTPATLFLFMSFKKPVVAPDIPQIRETASEDFCIFFKPNNVRSFSEAMLTAFSRKDEMPKMGMSAFRKALLFDWNSIGRRTFDLYISSL